MIKVEFTVFFALLSTILILFAIGAVFVEERKKSVIKKDTYLRKEKCKICASVYFMSPALKYWRCPFCKSLN